MTNRVLRWGLLSTARINRALITPLRASTRNQLAAVASRTRDKADAYAKENNIPRAFDGYEAMLADPDIDVIYNPLPNHLHAVWTIKAAQAGKHVLCEKPLAIAVQEVEAMADAAAACKVVVAEAFMYRHHPQTLKVKELLDSGAIGKLRVVKGAFTFNLTREVDVRLDPAMGGGSVWDLGCYPISYVRTMVGAEPVEAFGWQVPGKTGVDETFTGQLRFPGDVLAQFDCGFRAPFRAHMELVGSEGCITVPTPFRPGLNETILLTRHDRTESIAMAGQALYSGEVEDMADAVLDGKAPRVTLADSRANVAAMLALLQSAREGRPVTVG
ncbi:MAG: Gfo/Idh/MocA family oxidoreductase [Chloroflexi bacterium]|nr:Gfo/Idh/MocA family oxidoreductase [Chloroflexota bacterium]